MDFALPVADFAERDGTGGIAVVTLVDGTEVKEDHLTWLHLVQFRAPCGLAALAPAWTMVSKLISMTPRFIMA